MLRGMKTRLHIPARPLPLLCVLAALLAPAPAALADPRPAPDPDRRSVDIPGYQHHRPFVSVVRAGYADWDAAASLLASDLPDAPGRWVYTGRIRYRLAADHRVALETVINLGAHEPNRLVLGYYGSVADNWSLRLAIWTTL